MITLRLFGQDYSSFHDFCRKWRSGSVHFPEQISPCQSHIPIAQIPWLVYFEEEAHVLNVSHPLCKDNLIEILGLSDARICCSKDVFFLNPFNKTRIELPDFPPEQWDYPSCGTMDVYLPALSFSSPPISSNCVVFGISSSWDHDEAVSICMISRGEASWTIHQHQDNNESFVLSNVNPVYHNGIFYCLYIEDVSSFFVQCNGNLFLVFQGCMGNAVFNQVQHLEDHMFFSSGQISLSARTVEAFNEMGNKIYFPLFPFSCDGSSSGRMYHSFGNSLSSGDISRMKILNNCVWVEPNFVIPSNEDLIWAI
ncbi:hypothetical protein NE237_032366 [Protea cynaroides]|uniref:KIB1-4 beta-propeller domain-containing protein n=1 Tax=Protea cynaroides TaxID=273540 RepID=A0A9Q0L380_9MAGN|nr:hypothetical protein NE237_032366 [Protea cynaroides]